VDPVAGYSIAVRAMCEFTAKRGDLDLRFTPSPSAQEGMAGHLLVAAGAARCINPKSRCAASSKQLARARARRRL
jgi:DNA excision repair protein ERCC-2